MAQTIKFSGWERTGAAVGGTRGADPARLQGATDLTLDVNDGAAPSSHEARFLLMGPADVTGLRPSSVVAVKPPPADQIAETTKCPQVEFSAVDLPWRYSHEPSTASSKGLRPWLVLVAGTSAEILLEPDNLVTLEPSVTRDYDLRVAARWAHVQQDGSARLSRLVSERKLAKDAYQLAVIVPAFNEVGAPSWRPGERVTVRAYYWWHFRTAPDDEDFKTLAEKLLPIETTDPAVAGLGLAPVSYPTAPATLLGASGAVRVIGSAALPLPANVHDDLEARRKNPVLLDPRRPVIGLPQYGDAWVKDPDATGWGARLNEDPRPRGAAGLGAWAGIVLQEEIASAATDRAGALFTAAARIRGLTMGLMVSKRLWENRLLTTTGGRLMLFGPSMQRMPTSNGSVLKQTSDLTPGRPLPAALFSSAAKRLLRPGTAWHRHAQPGALGDDAVLSAANECPPAPTQRGDGLPDPNNLVGWLKLHRPRKERRGSIDRDLDRAWRDPSRDFALDPRQVHAALGTERVDRGSLREFIRKIRPVRIRERCRPVDLAALDDALRRAVDPRGERALARRRVLGTIQGLGSEPLAPTEFCPDFDLPGWRFLRDHARDWLLPGAGRIPDHRVVALETNAAFSDAFLVGFNTQALGELRWRNIPIRSGCTPLRRFWERVNAQTNTIAQDIRGIADWSTGPAGQLGDPDHVPVGSPGADLVLLFHTPLFRRFPGTLVYLFPEPNPTAPQWTKPVNLQGAAPVFPSFQGEIEPNFTFFCFPRPAAALKNHWVVVEEVQRGYRFYNRLKLSVAPAVDNGRDFAIKAFVQPTRVLIQGTELDPFS
jgi:hypothetical protein